MGWKPRGAHWGHVVDPAKAMSGALAPSNNAERRPGAVRRQAASVHLARRGSSCSSSVPLRRGTWRGKLPRVRGPRHWRPPPATTHARGGHARGWRHAPWRKARRHHGRRPSHSRRRREAARRGAHPRHPWRRREASGTRTPHHGPRRKVWPRPAAKLRGRRAARRKPGRRRHTRRRRHSGRHSGHSGRASLAHVRRRHSGRGVARRRRHSGRRRHAHAGRAHAGRQRLRRRHAHGRRHARGCLRRRSACRGRRPGRRLRALHFSQLFVGGKQLVGPLVLDDGVLACQEALCRRTTTERGQPPEMTRGPATG